METSPEISAESRSESGDLQITTELSRNLNLLHITMMGVGMMIGAGVFLGVGNAVQVAGPGGVILTFALNAVIALFTAMSYAELSSAVPRRVSWTAISKQNRRLSGTTADSLPTFRLTLATLAPSMSSGMEAVAISIICMAMPISCIRNLYSIIHRTASLVTVSPLLKLIALTVPFTGLARLFSIFMASSTTTVSPWLTASPTCFS